MSNNEALRLINNRQNAHLISWQANACAELRRLHDLLGKANALCRIRAEEIERLKAQPEQEPVAKKHEPTIDLDKYAGTYGGYTTPQQRKPLTLSVVREKARLNVQHGRSYRGCWDNITEKMFQVCESHFIAGFREAEAAHGIKE